MRVRHSARRTAGGALAATLLLLAPLPASAQDAPGSILRARGEGGGEVVLPLARHRGFPAVPLQSLEPLGFASAVQTDGSVRLRFAAGEVVLRDGNPFVWAAGSLLQLAAPPYRIGEQLHLPAQLLLDLLPTHFPGAVTLQEGIVRFASAPRLPEGPRVQPAPPSVAAPSRPAAPGPDHARTYAVPQKRVVIIDPGHGGSEPGAVGPSGVREKDVALAVGLALAERLRKDPTLEVHLTRDRDVTVPLWERGAMATRWKGDRPGIFISIHANSAAGRRAARGFETYFLAEARTEDARRVAALENASMPQSGEGAADGLDPGLGSILNELRLLDHQHWSALLAEFVQQELSGFHPGPNRGVKQGPFAVLTNALMPSVLVEMGFISNRDEERLMTRRDFQLETAASVAAAVERFFQRYPPGQGGSGEGR